MNSNRAIFGLIVGEPKAVLQHFAKRPEDRNENPSTHSREGPEPLCNFEVDEKIEGLRFGSHMSERSTKGHATGSQTTKGPLDQRRHIKRSDSGHATQYCHNLVIWQFIP